jgi:membrane protein DedA with SNARE-associated domain
MSRFVQLGSPTHLDRTRRAVAYLLLAILAGVLLVSAIAAFSDTAEFEVIVAGIVTPIVGLVGAVVGFYFGSKS